MRNKKFIFGIIILIVSMFIVSRLLLNHHKVEVMQVKRGDVLSTVFAKGEIESENIIDVSSKMIGEIKEVFVKEGKLVRRGQIIGELESDEIRANMEERQAELNSAKARLTLLLAGARPEEIRKTEANLQVTKATLENSRRTYVGAKRLYGEKIIPKEEIEKIETQYKVAEAQYQAANEELKLLRKGAREEDIKLAEAEISRAEASLSSAQAILNNTIINAPISGMVIRKHLDTGETVVPGMPIFTIVKPDQMWVKIRIDGSNIGKVKIGQSADVILESFPKMRFEGQMAKIAYEADRVTEDFDAYVRINNHKKKILRSGMKADVNIYVDCKKDVVLVPRTAVFSRGSNHFFVYIVRDSRGYQQKIKTGMWGDTLVEILEGIKEGEKIITNGWKNIKDGDKITVVGEKVKGKDKKGIHDEI
ncbi:MAG: efflux RND transporter periplasmic adaptor subunit [bacterium]